MNTEKFEGNEGWRTLVQPDNGKHGLVQDRAKPICSLQLVRYDARGLMFRGFRAYSEVEKEDQVGGRASLSD
jgi:hypothetical protein